MTIVIGGSISIVIVILGSAAIICMIEVGGYQFVVTVYVDVICL